MQVFLVLTNRIGAKIPSMTSNNVSIDFDIDAILLKGVPVNEAIAFGKSLWPDDKKRVSVGRDYGNTVVIRIPISILTQFKIK